MLLYPVADLFGEVEARTIFLDLLDDAHALLVVPEAVGQELAEELLADVTERCVPDVVAHRHRLDEVFIQTEAARHRAADLRDLERMRETRAVVVADRGQEDLRLVLEAPERLAVNDAVAVDRERRSRWGWLFGPITVSVRGAGRMLGEVGVLEVLGVLADAERGDGAGARKLRVGACLCGHFA